MKRKTTTEQILAKKRKIEYGGILEYLAINQGLSHLVNHIFSYLNASELAKCRRASKSLLNVIHNNKQWWILQLEYTKKYPATFIDDDDDENNDKEIINGLIEDQFPLILVQKIIMVGLPFIMLVNRQIVDL